MVSRPTTQITSHPETSNDPFGDVLGSRKLHIPSAQETDDLAGEMYREGEKWRSTLTEKEESAVFHYSLTGYMYINSILNDTVDSLYDHESRLYSREQFDDLIERNRARIDLIDSALDKADQGKTRTVYRYQRVPTDMSTEHYLHTFDDEITFTSFLSTSQDIGFPVAHTYRKHEDRFILLSITTSKGASLQQDEVTDDCGIQSLELERLLPRVQTFFVDGEEKVTVHIPEDRTNLYNRMHLHDLDPVLLQPKDIPMVHLSDA